MDGQKLAAQPARYHPVSEINKPVSYEKPHGCKVPLCPRAQPAAKRDAVGKAKRKRWICIMDLPSAHNHEDHGSGIDPMRDSNDQGMDQSVRRDRGVTFRCNHGALPNRRTAL